MKNVLYNEVAQRWEVINNFHTGMGIAFNWQSPIASQPTSLLTVSKTVAHPSYKEAKEKELQLLIKRIFMAQRINVWEGVKWDT
jgi:hypothetical protein